MLWYRGVWGNGRRRRDACLGRVDFRIGGMLCRMVCPPCLLLTPLHVPSSSLTRTSLLLRFHVPMLPFSHVHMLPFAPAPLLPCLHVPLLPSPLFPFSPAPSSMTDLFTMLGVHSADLPESIPSCGLTSAIQAISHLLPELLAANLYVEDTNNTSTTPDSGGPGSVLVGTTPWDVAPLTKLGVTVQKASINGSNMMASDIW